MPRSSQFAGRTVLITGASAGIGAALAREFAARGARLVLSARRLDRLNELAAELRACGAEALVHEADVTRDGDIARIVAAMQAAGGAIDVVVANAGFGVAGPIRKLSVSDYRRQYETNVFGVLRTICESLEALRRSRGQLVLIGSVAAYIAASHASAYASTKFAVRAISEAIRGELRGEGIRVTLVSPGFVDSDIRRTDNRGALHAGAPDPVPAWLRMRSDRAARIIVSGIARRRAEVIVTAHGKALVFLGRHCTWLVRLLTQRGRAQARSEPQA